MSERTDTPVQPRARQRGLPRRNDESERTDALQALRDTPDGRVVRAAHPFGTCYLRYDDGREQWLMARLVPAVTGGSMWREARVYPNRMHTLLAESEFSIVSADDYPET